FAYLVLGSFASDQQRTAVINGILLAVSIGFYYWGEKGRVWILLCVILLTFLSGLIIGTGWRNENKSTRVVGLGLGLAANAGFLLWFKYAYFGYETLAPI